MNDYNKAKEWIAGAKNIYAFTGAGISVESGIQPFRGKDGIYGKYDARMLEIEYFLQHPNECWPVIYDVFYRQIKAAKPNVAHIKLAESEAAGKIQGVITQNIDGLHARAGTRNLVEFHGTCSTMVCMQCGNIVNSDDSDFKKLPPVCSHCQSVLKPNFVFFGESIPHSAYDTAMRWMQKCDLLMVIGTSGIVFPAASIPQVATMHGAKIIIINPDESGHQQNQHNLFLKGGAVEVINEIL